MNNLMKIQCYRKCFTLHCTYEVHVLTKMLCCQFCDRSFESVLSFFQHMKIHSHVPNADFKCGVPDCSRKFKKYTAFKAHIFRDHKKRADEMRKHDPNPTRSQCISVTRQIVRKYPKTFADMMGDRQVGGEYESLLSQLKVRIEHLNRKSTLSHHRIQSNDTGTTRKRSTTDLYGCTRWQPALPPGESYDSLEVKRQKMEIHLHEGISGAERGDICKLMEETYCLQRHMINATPSPTIAELRTKWPYLFIQRHIYGHFEQLTDRNVRRLLKLSIQECGQIIIQFFKGKPTNDDVRNILARGENDVAAMVIQLLLAHFKEKLDGLILQADVSRDYLTNHIHLQHVLSFGSVDVFFFIISGIYNSI